MKHNVKITLILLFIFVLAQINGIFVIDYYVDIKESALSGTTVVDQEAYEYTNISPPEVENESVSYIYIILALLLGTALILLLIKFRQQKIWKAWFFLSVVITLVISLNSWMFRIFAWVDAATFLYVITVALSCIFAYYKIFKQNIILHNVTEIFIYGGLAALLVPILNITSVVILLLLVAAYDAYAVWKSKHMVKLAKFQTAENVFAGLYIPYKAIKKKGMNAVKKGVSRGKKARNKLKSMTMAILGGGDVAFPLLFSGVVMKTTGSYLDALVITVCTTVALGLLFLYGEKGKFYPAIPFIAVGCFVGYGIVLLL
jgi:presenilin-like A22 family membrane protease